MTGERPTENNVTVTIRKPTARAISQATFQESSSIIFVAKFSQVKPSLSTFLKFWLMGGCGAEGWSGTGELEAQHSPSGTKASILIDIEQSTVSLASPSAASPEGNLPLNLFTIALLDEMESLAKTEEANVSDRLCYPPEAVDAVRFAAWAACAPREYAGSASGEQNAPPETEFQKFLRELKEKEK